MPPATDTLRRTPLFDRHEAAGARLVPFAGWEMPVQYEGIRQEHVAVRTGAGVFDVSHMGEIETSGPDAEAFLQRMLSNDVTKLAEGGAQYSVLCREDGGVLDDLFTYRLGRPLPDRHQRLQPRARPRLVRRARRRGFDVDGARTPPTDCAMLAVQGPDARAMPCDALASRASCPRGCARPRVRSPACDCLVCGTGYTGEDGVELLIPPDGAPAVWDALMAEGVTPAGLGARDTLRLEVCFHLYGNDLSEDRNPIEAGLGWCCKLDTGFIGSDALRDVEPAADARRRSPSPARASRARATRCTPTPGEGVVTSGTMSPCLGIGIGMAYVPVAATEPGTAIEVDVRGKPRAAEVREKPLYEKEELTVAESYPEDLKYHPEHDWARIEGDEATFGITWYAQDALGEVVFYDPPEVGATVTKDQAYAEVESVKAVSDVFAPLSGEIMAVNEALRRHPRARSTPTPTARAGWSRSSSATRPRWTPCSTWPRTRTCCNRELTVSRYTSATDADRQAMLDAIGVGSLDDLFAEIPAGVRLERPLDLPDGHVRAGGVRPPGRAGRAQPPRRRRGHLPRRRDVRPLRAVADRLDPGALGVPDAVHALPAGDLARAGCR